MKSAKTLEQVAYEKLLILRKALNEESVEIFSVRPNKEDRSFLYIAVKEGNTIKPIAKFLTPEEVLLDDVDPHAVFSTDNYMEFVKEHPNWENMSLEDWNNNTWRWDDQKEVSTEE